MNISCADQVRVDYAHQPYTCPACGWSKTVTPQSDALMPGDVFEVCPKCGHEPLESHEASAARGALASLAQEVKRLLR